MAIRVGLNGFGRIGKNLARLMINDPDVELVAFNARKAPADYAYTFKYDSVHGNWPGEITVQDDGFTVEGKKILMTADAPGEWKWGELGCDLVVEATGVFRDRASCQKHLECGAKKVIISAPGKDPDVTLVYNVNHNDYDPAVHNIISNASCTTNCLAPAVKVLDEAFGIEHGLMTTIHAYTSSQLLLDGTNPKDYRRGRAAAMSLVPTTTGAAKSVALVLPQLKGKMDGMSVRCPTPDGSLTDLSVVLKKATTKEEVNAVMKAAANETLGYSEEPIVSCDIIGDTHGGIVDAPLTTVIGGTMLKLQLWYDNEMGFNNQLMRTIKHVGASL